MLTPAGVRHSRQGEVDLARRPAAEVDGRTAIWAVIIGIHWIGLLSWFRWAGGAERMRTPARPLAVRASSSGSADQSAGADDGRRGAQSPRGSRYTTDGSRSGRKARESSRAAT